MSLRIFLSTLMAFLAAFVGAQTSVTMHSDSHGISWALVRVGDGGVATVGDLDGVPIGEVHQDDLFFVRDGKAYEVRDESVMRQVEAADGPVAKIRDQRLKAKAVWREVHLQEQSDEREYRSFDRDKIRLERNADRDDVQRQITEIDRQMADLDRQIREMTEKVDTEQKKVDAIFKTLSGARAERQRKVQSILDEAFAKGLAKPYP